MKSMRIAVQLCFAAAVVVSAASAQAQVKPGVHPQANCIADINRERANYQRNLDAGIKGGKIDPKEHAALNKTHGDLMAMEKKAAEDHKMSAAECKAIHGKVMEEHKRLQMALATPAGRPGPGAIHPQAACIADINRERANYQRNLDAGIKGGRIDPKEHAMLNKTHADLMAMEKKAAEDHKMSPAECKAIHAKVMEEHKRLQMAMATPAKK